MASLMDWVREAASRMTLDNRAPVQRLDGEAARTRTEVTERYSNKGEIARGGMGAICIVHDEEMMRYTAMKVFDPADGIKNEARYEIFVEEAQITGQLQHPNICPVHDVGKDEKGTHYFTMKLVKGRTLADIVRSADYDPSSADDIRMALSVVIKVCDALAYAHSRGVIHRDLKPENIMVGDFGEVYLMDWGVAKLIGVERTFSDMERVRLKRDIDQMEEAPGSIVGTLAYMSPEQARGLNDEVAQPADIFGMGAILYEVLTQVPPYFGRDLGETVLLAQSGNWRPPQDMCGEDIPLPAALCAICEKALSADAKQRFSSVAELQKELESFLRGGLLFPSQVFGAGDVVVTQGDDGDRAFIIQRGFCRVFKLVGGEQVSVADLGPGDVFGETSVFANTPRTATVQALTDVTVQVIERDVFEKDMGMASSMGAFVGALARRFVDTDRQLRDLQTEVAKANNAPAPVELAAEGAEMSAPAPARRDSDINPLILLDAVAKLQALASDPRDLGDLLIEALSRGVDTVRQERRDAAGKTV